MERAGPGVRQSVENRPQTEEQTPDIEPPASADAAQLPTPEEDDGARWSLVLMLL